MNSSSWNDYEDMRLIAQILGEEEKRRSHEEDELKKTVEKLEPTSIPGDTSNSVKGSSQSYNDIPQEQIPEERRRALAQRLREQKIWSSDEEEFNAIPEGRRRALAKRLREKKNWSSDEEEFNAIPEGRRRALAQRLREKKNWSSEEEEFNAIPEEWRRALAQGLREKKNWSSDQEEDELQGAGNSQSWNAIPEARRRALALRLREEENWSSDEEEDELQIYPLIFSKCEIEEATNNLSDSLKIGEGGYGSVYRGFIDNTDVAIKILSNTSEQGMDAFHRELGALNGVRHANLVNLIGSCSEVGALVYEYVPNGSLEDCLMERPVELTWEIRTRIIYEICTILIFLHSNQPDPLVHGDLKPRNVLLDANFEVKLADFGLCRFLTQGESISTKFHQTKVSFGSPGYTDPEFLGSRKVIPAIDVYSFGKTIIRILTKERPSEISRKVHDARKTKTLMTIVDPAVSGWPEAIVELIARFALRCCKYDRYKPEFMRKFYTDLQMKLDDIDASTTTH